jgi:ABC-type branched-subunit amino acid transport system substrate-binding protein
MAGTQRKNREEALMDRRGVCFAFALLLAIAMLHGALAEKKYDRGASDSEIKIGQTMPYSGPVSALGMGGRVSSAYYKMLNERGGINGRKITMISLDDGYSPPKTVEQTRRLVEEDGVLALFGSLGTPTNVAVRKYLNLNKIPQLLVASSSSQWNNPREFPYSTILYLGANQEADAFAHYVMSAQPDAKVGVLYQDDDFGKDYLKAFREGLGPKADSMLVKAVSYQAADPTMDQQILTLMDSGAQVLMMAASTKYAAQAIHKIYDVQWRPLLIVSAGSTSVKAVLEPAGFERAKGLVSLAFFKDPTDPQTANDPDVVQYFQFMQQNLPNEDARDFSAVVGYVDAQVTAYILSQCRDELTHENVLRQATNLKNPPIGLLRAGVSINTSPDNYLPFSSARLMRFDGTSWVVFGAPIQMNVR